jgi:hypothetical protein
MMTASGLGFHLTLRTGTNCHRPSIARYFLRFTLTAMFTIDSDPFFAGQNTKDLVSGLADDSNLDSVMDSMFSVKYKVADRIRRE